MFLERSWNVVFSGYITLAVFVDRKTHVIRHYVVMMI